MGVALGNLAEWVAGLGTVLAFGATSMVIWRDQSLRQKQHSEEMQDRALLVHLTVGPGATWRINDRGEREAAQALNVTVTNSGPREINHVRVRVSLPDTTEYGGPPADLIQAQENNTWVFPAENQPIDLIQSQGWKTVVFPADTMPLPIWPEFGSAQGPRVRIDLSFSDTDGTRWIRCYPSDELRRLPRSSRVHKRAK